MNTIKKIAFVNHRYGAEVAGGSEAYTKAMAEHLAEYFKVNNMPYEVEVLTSTAIDFKTWENAYEPGVDNINGVTVRRFPVKKKRSRLLQRSMQILMHNLGIHTKLTEELRLIGRGPYVPEEVQYVKEHKDEYEVFIFVTYMFYPVYFAAREVYDKAIFIPTAHDEEPIYMNAFHELFNKVKGIIYLAEEEKNFVNKTFHNEKVKSKVLGMGIEVPENTEEQIKTIKEKYGIKPDQDYLVYAGRIVEEKGCPELFEYFQRYKEETESTKITNNNTTSNKNNLALVLMGKSLMDIPKRDDIIYAGFVSDEDKYALMQGAKIISLPSKYESFSISLLEGMSYGHPGLVNGHCEVLKGHIDKSGGGYAYTDYNDFKETLNALLEDAKKPQNEQQDETDITLGQKAKAYVESNYAWDAVMKQFVEMIIQ